ATMTLANRYEPDDYYRVKRIIGSGGETNEFDFDYAGRVICTRVPGAYEEFFGYDGNGNLRTNRVGAAESIISYDGHDRPTTTMTAAGARIARQYDNNHNLQDSTVANGADGTPLAGTHYLHDELDRPKTLSRETDSGLLTSTVNYQSPQRRIEFTSPLNE